MKKNETLNKKDGKETLEQTNGKVSGGSLKYVVGGVVIALAGAVLIANLPDIKRYIKISTM